MKFSRPLLALSLSLSLSLSLGLVALPGCSRGGATTASVSGVTDLQFAQTAITSLANGEEAAEGMIDFETLNMMGMDAGKTYMAMPESGKAPFRKSFISSFSSSFKGTGATVESLKNWRVQSSDANKSVIATDGLKGPLYLTVTKRTGKQLLSAVSVTP